MQLSFLPLGLAVFLFQPLASMAQANALPTTEHSLRIDNPVVQSSDLHSESPITLSRAIQNAFANNPELIANARNIDITDAAITQAKVLPNPELAALTEGLDQDKRTTTVQINQVIELGGKRSSRITAANRDHEAALADLASQRVELQASVTGAFLTVFNAQERIQLAEASHQLAVEVTEVVKRRVAAGRISPIEETRTSVVELTMLTELNQAKTEFSLAKTRLAALWGETAPNFTLVAKPDIEKIVATYDDLPTLQARLNHSPQLLRARLEIQRQQAQTDIEQSRRIGDLTVSVGNKREAEFGRSQTVLGVSIPIPLFDRNQGNVLGASRKTDKARDELNAIERRLRNELSRAYQQYESTRQELGMLQTEILPKAKNAFDATEKGFEFGKFNLLDVLEAQRTLFQTKLQYLQVQAEFYDSITNIERIAGSDIPEATSAQLLTSHKD